MVYICIDNEGYMNTGVQRSGTTPFGAWTSTTPVGPSFQGKTRDAKYMPMIMLMNNCEYVATASTAFLEDYYDKLNRAIAAFKRGLAYIHVFSPCPTGWRYPPELLIEIGRKAVQTNMVPLWDYSAKDGPLSFTHLVDNPLPVPELLALIGKYRHLSTEQLAHIQKTINQQIQRLKLFQQEKAKLAANAS